MNDVNRVVVTGLGAVTPVGHTAASYWAKLKQGVSGIGPITLTASGVSSDAHIVATTEETDGIPAACRKGRGQRRTGPSWTNYSDGVHQTSFGVPAPLGCRSPTAVETSDV